MSALDEFFDSLETEYDGIELPKPSRRSRLRGAIFDARHRLAQWLDPYNP